MSKDIKTQACPECGSVMRFEERDDVLVYKGQSRSIKTLGWWCMHRARRTEAHAGREARPCARVSDRRPREEARDHTEVS